MPLQPSTLTESQEKLLSLLPVVPTMLSMFGSSAIINHVARDPKGSPYKRILFGLSVADIILSVVQCLQPFAMPKETSYRVWAIGNSKTCSAAGALTQLGFAAMWYNGMLSLYYLLTVRFGVTEAFFAKRVEPFVHFLSISYPLITSIYGLVLGVYNELDLGMGCWVSSYPTGCDLDPNDDFKCKSFKIGMAFIGYPFAIILLVIILNKIIIFAYVRKTVRRIQLRSSYLTQDERFFNVDKTRAVATQALMYVLAFLTTYIWGAVLRFMDTFSISANDEAKFFTLLVLNAIFLPMLGFFNLLIFTRPRYLQCRKRFPKETRVWAFQRVILGDRATPTRASSRNAVHHVSHNKDAETDECRHVEIKNATDELSMDDNGCSVDGL